MHILIADDLIEGRLLLEGYLRQLGHQVTSVEDGDQAFETLVNSEISFLITDWMMPNLSGVDLCKKIRSYPFDRYVYIILLTARSGRDEIIEGLDAGADDFLAKPFIPLELKSRITTGARILALERKLEDKNRALEENQAILQRALSIITRDLEAAAILQKELLPSDFMHCNGYNVYWLFEPSQVVAGDIFNYFQPDEDHLIFYQLDVAGHGIASAMLSYTLSKFLSPHLGNHNLLLSGELSSVSYMNSPSVILDRLNEMFYTESDAMQFFTICVGALNLKTHELKLSRAGHPYPMLIRNDGSSELVNLKGVPIGIIQHATYQNTACSLEVGDRLYVYSDGITEAQNPSGEVFGEARLKDFFLKNISMPLKNVVFLLQAELTDWRGHTAFSDDISLLVIERAE
ncbi:MAG: SpoIIE family protein phosphatase [Ignavibacteria bacterium]|nr:SpoIIE family protein phosphatase [Ignavibacteria bacterium]